MIGIFAWVSLASDLYRYICMFMTFWGINIYYYYWGFSYSIIGCGHLDHYCPEMAAKDVVIDPVVDGEELIGGSVVLPVANTSDEEEALIDQNLEHWKNS